MTLRDKQGVELRLPDHRDLPCKDGERLPPWTFRVPDHTDLPDSDDEMENPQELPQAVLLTDSIRPILRRLHPDGRFFVGSNSGIYWTLTDPPRRGAVAPDWFYVPGVDPTFVEGRRRRSYVMWKEVLAPLIVLEFVSGDGSQERDRTPQVGKFWVYEQAIRVPFYGIYEVDPGRIEIYRLVNSRDYVPVEVNERGHYPVPPLGELGIWTGRYFEQDLPWLRWWDDQGNLLMTHEEQFEQERLRAEQERQRAEQERQRAEQERQRAERLEARMRALGIDPDGA